MWPFPAQQTPCPVEPDVQQWIDGRFEWLREQLGLDMPRNVRVILPTPEFFPDLYEGRPDDAQSMLLRVAGYMNVDPDRFKLFIYSESNPEPALGVGPSQTLGSAGVYIRDGGTDQHGNPRAAIGINSSQLGNPMGLVATLAHEVGHEILLGQGRVSRDQQDHEPLTDLVTVFHGMGIFGANATISDGGWSTGTFSGWSTKRLGYLNQRMFGYALARFAWTRNETQPSWIRHVRPDVRAPLKQGLKFLAARQP